MQQIDFMQAYTQAPVEHDIYMELPQGIETKHRNSKNYVCVLKLLMNMYSQKQARQVWNQSRVEKLGEVMTSTICHGWTYLLLRLHPFHGVRQWWTFLWKQQWHSDTLIPLMKRMKDKGIKIKDQGHPADYIGVSTKKKWKMERGSEGDGEKALKFYMVGWMGQSMTRVHLFSFYLQLNDPKLIHYLNEVHWDVNYAICANECKYYY